MQRMKLCVDCNRLLPLSVFRNNTQKGDKYGKQTYCRKCADKRYQTFIRRMGVEYATWRAMRSRCISEHTRNKYWNGRGIKVCKRWSKFENFLADMGCRPSAKHSLDRIDCDGNYTPENCRWATGVEQSRNRQNYLKFSTKIIQQLRKEYTGKYGDCVTLARKYRTSRSYVWQIVHNKLWKMEG